VVSKNVPKKVQYNARPASLPWLTFLPHVSSLLPQVLFALPCSLFLPLHVVVL
jgi:hypothetical protein